MIQKVVLFQMIYVKWCVINGACDKSLISERETEHLNASGITIIITQLDTLN